MERKKKKDGMFEGYGMVPPHSEEAEVSVLGSMLSFPESIPMAIAKLKEEVFYKQIHKVVFKAILQLYDKTQSIDLITVVEQIRSNDELSIASPYEVTRLTNKVSTFEVSRMEVYVKIVLEYFLKRKQIEIGSRMMAEGFDPGIDVFDSLNAVSDEILSSQEGVLKGSIKTMADHVFELKKHRDSVKAKGVIGVSSGFKTLDKLIGGWVAPNFIVIAARPAMGKTAMVLSSLHSLSVVNGIPGAFFSLEMSVLQLTERLESIDSEIFNTKLRNAQLSNFDEIKLSKTEDRLAKAPIFIEDTPAINIRELRTRAHILKRKAGIQFIMLDYLQLMSPVSGGSMKSREQDVSEMSRGLKLIARELNIPVIALSQLSRAVESRQDKLPQLSDLRESGSIEQDADEVLFLMRPEYYKFTEPVVIKDGTYDVHQLVICKIDKSRHGPTSTVALRFRGEVMKYEDYHLQNDAVYVSDPGSTDDLPF
ncbi:replicative DNA helicase [Danxiaibacter flavus]|uniref:Replicative DNA helicase n=1 Tax=Danxiaibacter flavus TaxID=3049108 RepID=A0ABV3ZJI2_9BACT|nr:replicative DNA helicase [Chitinophagaceae bacterium DXS]